MTLRLAINATSLLSPLTGIGQYTRQLLLQFEKNPEIEAHYFYGSGWSDTVRDKPLHRIASYKEWIKKVMPRPYEVSRFVQQVKFDRGARKMGFDLYHDPNYLPFRFEGPIVTTVHDLSHSRYPETHPELRVRIMDKLLPEALARSARVLADSDFVKQEIASVYGLNHDKIHTVHLGVASVFRSSSKQETRSCLSAFELTHGQYILAVGTLEPRKNLRQALRAYQLLPESVRAEYPFVIVGMKGWLTDRIESKILELEKKGQVRLLGFVASEQLPLLYAGATMLLYPSVYEGFGLPVLEAMASGIPVITSNRSSLPEVAGDVGILIDPDDADQIRDAILTLVESPQERQSRAQRGIARASRFTWERCAAQTLSVYRLALSH